MSNTQMSTHAFCGCGYSKIFKKYFQLNNFKFQIMYRIVSTTFGDVIFIENNGKIELFSGRNLNDYEGTANVDLNIATDKELSELAERQIKMRA